jgi:indolepyruvate ferredoxin oxidoreductase beta subunit
MTSCDIVLIGVGGQGIVTLGDLISRAALAADVPVSYVPTKGMAQRGGFVKVEIRLGHHEAGPRVPASGADIVVAMERSEALKGLQFVHPEGRFILYDHVWEPAGVMLGNDAYPSRDAVIEALSTASGDVVVLDPSSRPSVDGKLVAANIYAVGALAGSARIQDLIDTRILEEALVQRWPKVAEANLAAFRAGLAKGNSPNGEFPGELHLSLGCTLPEPSHRIGPGLRITIGLHDAEQVFRRGRIFGGRCQPSRGEDEDDQ